VEEQPDLSFTVVISIFGAGGNDRISGAGAPWIGDGGPADLYLIDGGDSNDDLTERTIPMPYYYMGCPAGGEINLQGGNGDDRLHAQPFTAPCSDYWTLT
jgi:Ca2+-binding RTX toxin-like protein